VPVQGCILPYLNGRNMTEKKEPKYLEQHFSQYHYVHHRSSTLSPEDTKIGRRGDKPANNRLRYGSDVILRTVHRVLTESHVMSVGISISYSGYNLYENGQKRS